ncbi:hypothetical protein M9Y10_000480 [Tritrichomonas musculus]|uniref:Uncharacterized protein n=1 Tax=Tritrichomonas musculus TaxID=1915356 RepID=A0ABR2L7F1_9EUKA
MSDVFSHSDFFTSTPHQTPKFQRETISISLSLTMVSIKSVSFSISYYPLNSKYSCFPYVIQFLSPSYVPTYIKLIIRPPKGQNSSQLIGIVCGSAALFFSTLGIVIILIRKKNEMKMILSDEFYISDESSDGIENETFVNPIDQRYIMKNFDDWFI